MSLVLAGLCSTVRGQTKSVTAVNGNLSEYFNALFSNSPISISNRQLGRSGANLKDQFGIYTQTGGLFERLAPTGLVLSTGKVVDVKVGSTPTTAWGGAYNDPETAALIPGQNIADFASFDITITVAQDASISFSFVFASKAYNTGNSDVFGFWVNGVNIAKIGDKPVTTANVNCGATGTDRNGPNCDQYINNAAQSGTSLTGYTKTQIMVANLKQGQNTIKIAIADSYAASGPLNAENDSAVFLSITPSTKSPTRSPTKSPTNSPTNTPTMSPTKRPTNSPSKSPTTSPTQSPTKSPTGLPTNSPTMHPTMSPSNKPTMSPTNSPIMRSAPIAVPSPVAPPTSDSRSEKAPAKPAKRPSGKGSNGKGKTGKGKKVRF
jgi:hypothetical protein